MKNNEEFVPTRGNVVDIGPGLTHAKKIIRLFMEGYTESEIVRRTHHSYASVENYLDRFCKVVGLKDDGLTAVEIRIALGCSLNTVKDYLALVEEFDTKEYRWTMGKIRSMYAQKKSACYSEKEERVRMMRKGSRKPFASLPEKTPERIVLSTLKERLELSSNSLIGTHMIKRFDELMQENDKEAGINRVSAGELLEEHNGTPVVLPLLPKAAVERLASGGPLGEFFEHRELQQMLELREAVPEASPKDLWELTAKPVYGRVEKTKGFLSTPENAMERTDRLSELKLASPESVGANMQKRKLQESKDVPRQVMEKLQNEFADALYASKYGESSMWCTKWHPLAPSHDRP